jgi:proteasome lid subunit RPN8/RPN11
MIALSAESFAAIQAHGSRDYPYECCGFLLGNEADGRKLVVEAWPAANSHEDTADETRRRRYLITPADMIGGQAHADAKGLSIVGFYHSHPDHPARPSQTDLERAGFDYWSYIILSVEQGRPAALTSWLLTDNYSKFTEETVEICQ